MTSRGLVRERRRATELDLLDPQQAAPLWLIAQTVSESLVRFFATQEDVDRLKISVLNERPNWHEAERNVLATPRELSL
jgi:hypothetical protein